MLDVELAALDLIATLANLMPAIAKHDRDLARQLVRAANSIALNSTWRRSARRAR